MVSNTADLAATDTNPPRQTSSRFPGWAIALIATLTVVVLAAAALGGFVAYAMRVNKRRLRDVVAGRWRAVEEEGWKAEAVEGMMPGARFERYYG